MGAAKVPSEKGSIRCPQKTHRLWVFELELPGPKSKRTGRILGGYPMKYYSNQMEETYIEKSITDA